MGGRYLVTGVQLGMIKTLTKQDPNAAIEEIEKIIKEQYTGESHSYILLDVKRAKNRCMDGES